MQFFYLLLLPCLPQENMWHIPCCSLISFCFCFIEHKTCSCSTIIIIIIHVIINKKKKEQEKSFDLILSYFFSVAQRIQKLFSYFSPVRESRRDKTHEMNLLLFQFCLCPKIDREHKYILCISFLFFTEAYIVSSRH